MYTIIWIHSDKSYPENPFAPGGSTSRSWGALARLASLLSTRTFACAPSFYDNGVYSFGGWASHHSTKRSAMYRYVAGKHVHIELWAGITYYINL